MSASLLRWKSVTEQVASLTTLVHQSREEILNCVRKKQHSVRSAEQRQQISELRCEVGYWKSRYAESVKRNIQLQAELDQAQAEIRQLKAERFGKQSETQCASDRSNQLDDLTTPKNPKNNRGQQPGRPAPKRRDYSQLPVREELVDLPDEAKIFVSCGQPLSDLGYCADSEQLEIETVVYRQVVRRKRYRRTCNCTHQPRTLTAPLPAKLLPQSRNGSSIWLYL